MRTCGLVMLWVLLAGCGTASRVVRLELGQEETLLHTPPAGSSPVKMGDTEFERAVSALAQGTKPSPQPQKDARQLFEMQTRGGFFTYEPGHQHLTPLHPDVALEGEWTEPAELTRAYLRWCARNGEAGDCLRLLTESTTLSGDSRFALAMALAKGAVLDEMLLAFKHMADPHAVVAAVLWTWTTYMVLLALPDVTVTKGLAAVMTATLIAYVGVDTFWGLVVGFKRLMDEADRATTFQALREAGERYGKRMGRDAARAFALLALAATGNTAQGLATRVSTLPGSVQAAAQARTQLGLRLATVGEVRAVSVSAESVTLALAPSALAMTAGSPGAPATSASTPGFRSWGSYSGFKRAQGKAGPGREWHHIVEQTPGNEKRFGAQSLQNTDNIVPLDKGLHTQVSAFYSSVRRDITGSPLTVRKWLSTQSYAAQREFGILAIQNIRKGSW